jgi:outer membrane protein assembly factor BamB
VEVGYDGKTQLPTPLLVATIPLAPSIGTPIFTNAHQLVVPSYNGLYFFDITYGDNVTIRQTAHLLKGVSIEATPTVVGDRLYIAARNGYFYEIK